MDGLQLARRRGDNAEGNAAHAAAWPAVRAQVASCSVRLVVSNNHYMYQWQTAREDSRQADSMMTAIFQDAELEQHPARNHVQLSQASASSVSRHHDASTEARHHHAQQGVVAVELSPRAQSFNSKTDSASKTSHESTFAQFPDLNFWYGPF